MKVLLIIVSCLAVFIVAVSFYLGPDDLRQCTNVPSQKSDCQSADAIVAVSGGDTTSRTAEAIELYKAGWAPYIVFSGAARDKSGPSNALVMKRQAIDEGVPADVILTDENSDTTKENAAITKGIIADHSFKRIILVTSRYHQRRAGLEFQRVLGEQVVVVNHPVDSDNQWSSLWWLTPVGWYLAVGELLRIMVFYVGGGR